MKAQNTFRPDASAIAAIKEHALRNYNDGGWDYVVECWSDEDIRGEIAHCSSLSEALKHIQRVLTVMDDHRRDIQSEAF